MIGLIGYNFCSDANALDPTPTSIDNLVSSTVQNGIFDHFNITKNIQFDYSSVVPTDWDFDTLMNADFKGNVFAGNVQQVASGVTSVRVKRRIKGTFDWITIKEIEITTPEDMSFIITDNLNLNNTEYEYAFVPVIQNVEGGYIIESVLSQFDGIFICDLDTVYRFDAGVEYGNNEAVQQVGVFQPYNRQYPIIVSNSLVNYQTGSIGGWILPDDFEETGKLDRKAIVDKKNLLLNFLMKKKPKVIKDWNGNSWLVYFTSNPSVSYDNNYGMGMAKVSAQWTEVGDVNSKRDLFENGMIPTEE